MKTFQVTVIETHKKTVTIQAESEVMAAIKFRREYPSFKDPNIAVTGVQYKDVRYLPQLPEGCEEEMDVESGVWTILHPKSGVRYSSKDRDLAISKVSSEVSRRLSHTEIYDGAVDETPTPED